MKRIHHFLALLVLIWVLVPSSAQATDSPAQTVVRGFYAQLVTAMKQGEQLGFSGRYKKLDPVIRASFNLPLMTKLAVGSSWSSASPQEQSDLVSAFSDFSVSSYASRFAAYDGEQFNIIGEKTAGTNEEDGVIVQTSLRPKDGSIVSLNYLLRQDDKGVYRIIDVFINGTISELATRRAEFSSIARHEGIPALVNSLGEKSRQLGPS